MADRQAGVVRQQVLLGHIGHVGAVVVLGEQMIEGLVLVRPDVLRNRQPVLLGVREGRVDVEDHAAERIDPVANHLADRIFGAVHVHRAESTTGLLTGR
jgi:glutamate synthase domain-containing protein 3